MTLTAAWAMIRDAWPAIRRYAPFAACIAIGYAACAYQHRETPVASTATEEVRLPNGTVQAARTPGGKLTLPAPTPKRGARQIAVVEIKLQGSPPVQIEPKPDGFCFSPEDFVCPPVSARIDVAERGGQFEIAARSPDGMLLDVRHVPRGTIAAPPDKRLTVVGNPRGDVVATFAKTGHRWSWAASAGYIDQSPWAAAGLGFSWR